jgi:hypothetical protein
VQIAVVPVPAALPVLLGAVAPAALALGAPGAVGQALGLAQYHAPLAPGAGADHAAPVPAQLAAEVLLMFI